MGVYMGLFLKNVLGDVYWWVLWRKNFLVCVDGRRCYFVGMGGCMCVRGVVSFAVFDKLFLLFQGLLDLYVGVCADDWVDGLSCVGGGFIVVS